MRLKTFHRTTYLYSLPARSSINELRLSPEENDRQKPKSQRLTIEPATELQESRDLFGNLTHTFEVEERHEQLSILVESEVETNNSDDLHQKAMEVPLSEKILGEQKDPSLYEFLSEGQYVQRDPETWREALDIRERCDQTYGGFIKSLSDFIFENCTYKEQLIHGMKSCSEVQKTKVGTCQDFSHLMLGYCRALGIPARYLSGYLYDPGIEEESDPSLIGAEYIHAWVEAHVPGLGWLGIDPTNQRWVDEHYISLAFGKDYHDVAPIRGSLLGGGKKRDLKVELSVTRA